jgi:hypothetical protein
MESSWGYTFTPLIIMMFCWGSKLNDDYK